MSDRPSDPTGPPGEADPPEAGPPDLGPLAGLGELGGADEAALDVMGRLLRQRARAAPHWPFDRDELWTRIERGLDGSPADDDPGP